MFYAFLCPFKSKFYWHKKTHLVHLLTKIVSPKPSPGAKALEDKGEEYAIAVPGSLSNWCDSKFLLFFGWTCGTMKSMLVYRNIFCTMYQCLWLLGLFFPLLLHTLNSKMRWWDCTSVLHLVPTLPLGFSNGTRFTRAYRTASQRPQRVDGRAWMASHPSHWAQPSWPKQQRWRIAETQKKQKKQDNWRISFTFSWRSKSSNRKSDINEWGVFIKCPTYGRTVMARSFFFEQLTPNELQRHWWRDPSPFAECRLPEEGNQKDSSKIKCSYGLLDCYLACAAQDPTVPWLSFQASQRPKRLESSSHQLYCDIMFFFPPGPLYLLLDYVASFLDFSYPKDVITEEDIETWVGAVVRLWLGTPKINGAQVNIVNSDPTLTEVLCGQ